MWILVERSNSLKQWRRWNLDPVWICCFKERVEQKVIHKVTACLTLGNETNLCFGENIQEKRRRKKKKPQGDGMKDIYWKKRKLSKFGKVMVLYEPQLTNVMLSVVTGMENSRWETSFANSPWMGWRNLLSSSMNSLFFFLCVLGVQIPDNEEDLSVKWHVCSYHSASTLAFWKKPFHLILCGMAQDFFVKVKKLKFWQGWWWNNLTPQLCGYRWSSTWGTFFQQVIESMKLAACSLAVIH